VEEAESRLALSIELPQEGQKAGELFKLSPQTLQKFGLLVMVKW